MYNGRNYVDRSSPEAINLVLSSPEELHPSLSEDDGEIPFGEDASATLVYSPEKNDTIFGHNSTVPNGQCIHCLISYV